MKQANSLRLHGKDCKDGEVLKRKNIIKTKEPPPESQKTLHYGRFKFTAANLEYASKKRHKLS